MDKIKLLSHNQDMVYRIEQAMMCGNRKIFYTEATGLGKSYIFMYLVNKYFKDRKVLYICPKNHIWYNMQEYKEFDLIKDCVTYICNADFNKIKLHHFGFDAIFIDEAHHLTAPIQGENILKLTDLMIENNPNSYVFGFTATPYVDGEMVGDKFFETSIIGMDLFDAIDSGILQKIHYAVAVKENIDLSDTEKQLAIKYNVDTTNNMVGEIMNQYFNVKHWLAYFTSIKELNENIPYFKQYFPEYKIFIIHSEIENTEMILKEFEMYEGKAILASVSMILEGIHPRTIEGILLYRNVGAINTFFQIIGRLGIMKIDTTPICIDIYNSYDNVTYTNIISSVESDRNVHGKNSLRDYIYMTPNTYKFLELSEIIYNLRYNTIHEYRGITWTSDSDLSRKLGKGNTYVCLAKMNGYTYEQIIDRCLDSGPNVPKTYRGITWITDKELSLKLGKAKAYVSCLIGKGKTHKEIIDYCLEPEPIHEYRGITWTSDLDLSRKLGKSDYYVGNRFRNGDKTYEQIIDRCLDSKPIICKTYRGITWTTDTDLCRKLDVGLSCVRASILRGNTYEKIIDKILDNAYKNGSKSYRGLEWSTDAELTNKLGKYKGYVRRYIRQGYTYEQIIDKALGDTYKN